MKWFILLLASLSAFGPAAGSEPTVEAKGHLLAIGGGRLHDNIMERFIDLAGGKEARICIIPMASSEPLETALEQKVHFEALGARHIGYVICTEETADADSILAKLNGVTGIFLSGGDQRRLTRIFLGTTFLETMRNIYISGGVIGGTSAGAAVMSEVMITGDELINPDSTRSFWTIQENNIETTPGFGFITTAILDQHFVTRKRHNRLISLVLEQPALLGIGIDEETAIIVRPDRTVEVLGHKTAIMYDASGARGISADSLGHLSAAGILMHILRSGQTFDLRTRTVRE